MKYVPQTCRIALLFSFIALCTSSSAQAETQLACYNIPVNSPMAEASPPQSYESWCYEHVSEPANSLYIYNIDSGSVKPELAFLVDSKGVITHGSLLAGNISVHKVSNFNPFSIPTEEPKTLLPINHAAQTSAIIESANAVRKYLLNNAPSTIENSFININNSSASAAMPWRGFWWPVHNFPMVGPLKKYDSYVSAHSGSNPGTVSWEESHHYFKGISWEGHCNGWAASSILRAEPRNTHYDAASGMSFSVSDQKGIYAELDYCANSAFYGTRNNGNGDPRDIYPALFHKTLVYYIGTLHKPVAMDVDPSSAVSNNVVSSYSMNMQSTGTNSYLVTATLRIHNYDNFATNSPGIAPYYTRVYRYNLTTDNSGNPVSGSWLSGNPDFIWVPLSPTKCGSNNQRLNAAWVNGIQNLP